MLKMQIYNYFLKSIFHGIKDELRPIFLAGGRDERQNQCLRILPSVLSWTSLSVVCLCVVFH